MKGTRWVHWKKGDVYRVICVALRADTDEEFVVYEKEGDRDAQALTRPLEEWTSPAKNGAQRYTLIP